MEIEENLPTTQAVTPSQYQLRPQTQTAPSKAPPHVSPTQSNSSTHAQIEKQQSTYHYYDHHYSRDLPPSRKHLAADYSILLAPKAERAEKEDEGAAGNEGHGEGNAEDEEAQGRRGVQGVLEAEELGDQDAGHGHGE
jgi:hypothetical protein